MICPEDLAAAVTQLRGRRSVESCAERGGLSPRSWHIYERGLTMPKEQNFRRLALGLGVTVDALQGAVNAAWASRAGEGSLVLVVVGGATILQPMVGKG